MPWCPKCKTEYKKGIDKCSDCGTILVASLKESEEFDKSKMLNFLYGPEEHVDTIRKYLTNQGKLKAYSIYNEKKDIYELFIKPEDQERAVSLVNQFMNQVNAQNVSSEEKVEKTKARQLPDNKTYRSTKDKAKDHKGSAILLLTLGFIGLIVIILMAAGIFDFVSLRGTGAILTYGVMGSLFLVFVIMGFVSLKSYKELMRIEQKEDDITSKLDSYCKENLTKEIIESQVSPFISDESQIYFYRAEFMKQTILREFSDINPRFLEDYIDEKYGEIFE